MSGPTETVDIVVRESGSKDAANNIRSIDPAARQAKQGVDELNTGMDKLKVMLGALGLGLGIQQILEMSEAYGNLTEKLRLNATSADDLVEKQQHLLDIATQTHQVYDGVVTTYVSLENATKGLGISSGQLVDVTDSIAKALAVSGKSAEDGGQAMSRLALALRTGSTDARVFTSLFLQMPELADAVGSAMGRSGADIKNMMENGQLSTRQLIDALARAGEAGGDLDKRFQRLSLTMSGAWTDLKTAITVYLGEADAATGRTSLIAHSIELVAHNLDIVIPLVLALGAAMTAFGIAATVAAVSVEALMVALGANKWAIIAGLVAAAISLFSSFGDKIKLTSDGSVTALGLVVGAARLLGDGIAVAVHAANDFWTALKNGSPAAIALAVAIGALDLALGGLAVGTIVGILAGISGGLVGLAFSAGSAALAIAPLVLDIVGLGAAALASAALVTKLTDATGATTGAYNRLAAGVDGALKMVKDKTAEAFDAAKTKVGEYAAEFDKTRNDVTRSASDIANAHKQVGDSAKQMAGDADIGLKAYGESVARAQKQTQAILQAMGQDVAAASIVINEAWHHAADDPDAGIKAYMQRQQEAEDAANKMLVDLVQKSHQAGVAQQDAAKQTAATNDQAATSVQKLGAATTDALQAADGAYTQWATAAEIAADKVIEADNKAADAARTGSSGGSSGGSSAGANGSFADFSAPWQTLNMAGITSADYSNLAMGGPTGDYEVKHLKAIYDAANQATKTAMDTVGITDLINQGVNPMRFAGGGSFMVGGSGGTDSQMVSFLASPDEQVTVATPGQQKKGGGDIHVHMTVVANDTKSFDRTRPQIIAALHSQLTRVGLQGS